MTHPNPLTTALLGGYSPQYDVAALAAAHGGDRVLPNLFAKDKNAAFSASVRHLRPRDQRPHTPAEVALFEEHALAIIQHQNLKRKRKGKLSEDQIDLVSISPVDSTITFRLLVAEEDPAACGATTVQEVIYSDTPAGYGPEMAQRMREGEGWLSHLPPRDVLARCVSARQRVVEAEQALRELVAAERAEFADAVNTHKVSMYAIQEATAAAGVRISQQGVRKLITKGS